MKKPIKSDLLRMIIDAGGELTLAWLERGYMAHRGRTFKDLTHEERMQIPELRKHFQQRLIAIEYRESGAIVRLTQRGGLIKLMEMLGSVNKELPAGDYCYVAFDIPERHRNFRLNFTTLLRHVGFERLQKSVWRTRRDVVRGMRLLLKMNPGIEKYIRVIVGNE